jgi:hypothetical protein
MRQIYAVSYLAIGTKSKYKIVSHFRVFRQVAQNLTPVQNSNPMSHSESCALDVNGNLMEASEISWQYDPDDPQPPNLTNTSTSTSSTPAPSNVFDVLMDKGHAPSNVVAGTRRSARVPKPAQKIRDRDAVTLATSARRPSHHVLRVTSDNEDDIYMDDGNNRDTDNDRKGDDGLGEQSDVDMKSIHSRHSLHSMRSFASVSTIDTDANFPALEKDDKDNILIPELSYDGIRAMTTSDGVRISFFCFYYLSLTLYIIYRSNLSFPRVTALPMSTPSLGSLKSPRISMLTNASSACKYSQDRCLLYPQLIVFTARKATQRIVPFLKGVSHHSECTLPGTIV